MEQERHAHTPNQLGFDGINSPKVPRELHPTPSEPTVTGANLLGMRDCAPVVHVEPWQANVCAFCGLFRTLLGSSLSMRVLMRMGVWGVWGCQ